MPRRRSVLPQRVMESSRQVTSAGQICRESVRILLRHPTHFHSISLFLFSPLPISLFIAHLLARRFPGLPSTTLKPVHRFLEQNGAPLVLVAVLDNSIFSTVICFPSLITFSLLGRAATVRSVACSYNGTGLTGRRLLVASGGVWARLLHTCFWEFLILLALSFLVVVSFVALIPNVLNACGRTCSSVLCFWGVHGLLGVPFCVGFAHVMVVGNLATVLTVLEGDCSGLESFVKAKGLVEERRQTALALALVSNVGTRLVECLFEFRLSEGMYMWEGSLLVSMYSFVLLFDAIANVVFYYSSKP